MNDDCNEMSREEKLRVENDFLKMKIMIEHGGHFCANGAAIELPPEIENEFLSNIIAFEKQFASRKMTTVFEKIGKPTQFKPAREIPDGEIETAWENLSEYLNTHGIDLSACSPKITSAELYRFTVEELFACEVDDINVPGMISGFIYDEFHPDHEYDNSRAAEQDCISAILNSSQLEWMHNFKDQIQLNHSSTLSKEEFKSRINRFKESYDDIELSEVVVESSKVDGDNCNVLGTYSAFGKFGNEKAAWTGRWQVDFCLDKEFEYWYINSVLIEGINF